MRPLKDEAPPSDVVLYVYYDFEMTQNTTYSDGGATLHVPNLVCLQQFCSRCEDVEDAKRECERCGVRKDSFWADPVGAMLTYLCRPRPWVKKVVAKAHNEKGVRPALHPEPSSPAQVAARTHNEGS